MKQNPSIRCCTKCRMLRAVEDIGYFLNNCVNIFLMRLMVLVVRIPLYSLIYELSNHHLFYFISSIQRRSYKFKAVDLLIYIDVQMQHYSRYHFFTRKNILIGFVDSVK